jgi:hypothetical protein
MKADVKKQARESFHCTHAHSILDVSTSYNAYRQAPTYIILDALGLHLPNLRICVTSRPEPDI